MRSEQRCENAVLASGGLNFAQAVGSDAGKSDFTAIATPMSFGAFYSYFIRTGLLSQDAYTLSLQAASIGSGSVIYGLEPYLDGVFVWDPIMFARNLQRATLAGNLAGDFLTPDRVDTLAGQLGVAEPNRTFGELMRADLGYIYSRLKYDAWRYIVASQENGSYDWLRADTPWQVHSLLIEFDPESDARFHTQSNRNINENIYDEIVKMLNDLVVPVPKLPPKTGVDITIQ
jgi:hypothetical protein